ncbi:MAG: TetR/AcrR family transcriptional regulator [Elusimicrobia bacterium]|nr:TetR/AcrR family transcriptional regulator [Elusimicrobiota bacterium]
MPIPAPRRKETAPNKKETILEAARRLMVRRGTENFVMDDVAREAGVAKGTLFLYYRSKEDLFCSAYANLIDHLGEQLDALIVSAKTGDDLLGESIKTILGYLDHNRDFILQFGAGRFAGCGGRSNDLLMGKFRENQRRLRAILVRCADGGSLKPGDHSYEGFALVGLCRSAMLEKIVAGSAKPLAGDARKVMNFFLHGAGR